MTIRELISKYGYNQSSFARRFGIPLRSVQGWVSESSSKRDCPEYTLRLFEECLEKDLEIERLKAAIRDLTDK